MKINIERKAWDKIRAYVNNCDCEIGGLGKVTTDGEDFFVSDAEIFTQTVTPTHVDMTAETLAIFQMEKLKKKESLVDYKFWWHSHAKMGTFFSSTDTDTINNSREFPWLVSFVTNHKHEMSARVDIYHPVHMYIDKVTVVVVDEIDQTIIDNCIAEIAEKVTFPVVPAVREFGFKNSFFQSGPLSIDADFLPAPSKPLTSIAGTAHQHYLTLTTRLTALEKAANILDLKTKKSKQESIRLKNLNMQIDNLCYQLDMIQ